MTQEEKELLRKEFNKEFNYSADWPNRAFNWFIPKLESKDKEIADLKVEIEKYKTLTPERVFETAKQDKLI